MVIKMFNDLVTADGDPVELAMYTHSILEIFKIKAEMDEEKKDQEFLARFGDFSIFDLMKSEMREDKKDNEKENGGKDHDRT